MQGPHAFSTALNANCHVALYDPTTGGSTIVAGSIVANSYAQVTSTTAGHLQEQTYFQLTSGHEYRLCLRSGGALNILKVQRASLLVRQRNAFTKTETQIALLGVSHQDYGTAQTTSTTFTRTGFITPAEMRSGMYVHSTTRMTGTIYAYFEATLYATSGYTAYARLYTEGGTYVTRPYATLRGHRLEVWCLALCPDNATLVSGARWRGLRLGYRCPPWRPGPCDLAGAWAGLEFPFGRQCDSRVGRAGPRGPLAG